jgi:hypothetical protein
MQTVLTADTRLSLCSERSIFSLSSLARARGCAIGRDGPCGRATLVYAQVAEQQRRILCLDDLEGDAFSMDVHL